tara:strand:+ start:5688 stop:6065 length:378 start_codon:yes stop_codon:yes gene_type:complete
MVKKINKKYIPKELTKEDKKKQIKSIKEKTLRPKLKSAPNKRSSWVVKFENKYGYKINQLNKISKEIIKMKGIKLILKKGNGAYFSSGSRPNQTPESWSLARLASVIMNGPARKVDMKIWNEYKL